MQRQNGERERSEMFFSQMVWPTGVNANISLGEAVIFPFIHRIEHTLHKDCRIPLLLIVLFLFAV